jgi:uncharacterized protein (TIGR00255 family)
MTGFGEASCQVGGAHYFLEIRSLNSKYYKATLRLPEEFQGLEAELESKLRQRLSRGSVFMAVKHTDVSADAAHEINERALQRYIEQLKKAPQIASGDVKIELGPLLLLPGVLQPPANEEERLDKARAALHDLLEKACDRLIKMRDTEGVALKEDLIQHRDIIADRLRQISERAPQISADYEARLRTRIDNMIREAGIQAEPADIIHEVAVAAERSDIAEEIARLTAHLNLFTGMVSTKDAKPVGRTLDFIAQEMLREANTIASKCGDSEVARWIVEVKGAIDRIKEQIQNVE